MMPAEMDIFEWRGVRILEYPVTGSPLGNVSSALETIGEARGRSAEWIAVPVDRCGEAFFDLRNGIAGEVLQKFVTYQICIAVVGDLSPRTSRSNALRDFVIRCNRGSAVWFVTSIEVLKERLSKGSVVMKGQDG